MSAKRRLLSAESWGEAAATWLAMTGAAAMAVLAGWLIPIVCVVLTAVAFAMAIRSTR